MGADMPAKPDLPLDGLHILVVDDDAAVRRFLMHCLVSHGAAVTVAPSAVDAAAVIESTELHALVSDIDMPGRDGYHVVGLIRGRSEADGRHVPAVALTGYPTDGRLDRVMAAGFDRLLGKPFSPSHLVASIAEVAGRTFDGAWSEG